MDTTIKLDMIIKFVVPFLILLVIMFVIQYIKYKETIIRAGNGPSKYKSENII